MAAASTSSTTQSVPIHLGDRSYDILIGSGLLEDPRSWTGLASSHQAVIVTNDTVGPLYAARLQAALRTRHSAVHVVSLPDGEEHKTWPVLNRIFDALLENVCDRKTVLYALGGGVVGD